MTEELIIWHMITHERVDEMLLTFALVITPVERTTFTIQYKHSTYISKCGLFKYFPLRDAMSKGSLTLFGQQPTAGL